MSADFVLYAIPPDLWPRWDYLASRGSWTGLSTEELERIYGPNRPGSQEELVERVRMMSAAHHAERAIFVAEVSFLKAGLTEDQDRYIPGPVQRMSAVLERHRGRRLTPALASALVVAMNARNRSIYQSPTPGCGVNSARAVKKWLHANIGLHIDSGAE